MQLPLNSMENIHQVWISTCEEERDGNRHQVYRHNTHTLTSEWAVLASYDLRFTHSNGIDVNLMMWCVHDTHSKDAFNLIMSLFGFSVVFRI